MNAYGHIQRTLDRFVWNCKPTPDMQERAVKKLTERQEFLVFYKKLIEIYQQKIKAKIAEVWGE